MSRSYKKQPIYKDRGDTSYNKRIRKRVHNLDLSDEDILIPISKEVTNSYNICDYKWDARDTKNEETIKRQKRK
jgi:hypothetical protein